MEPIMNEEQLKQHIASSMEAVKDGIDVATQVRLNAIRHQAVFQPKRGFRWLPMSGLAASVLLAAVLVWQFSRPVSQPQQDDWLSDVEMLAAEDDTEFYEDLEFLTWLDDNQLLESDI
jgi:hypothetical protein